MRTAVHITTCTTECFETLNSVDLNKLTSREIVLIRKIYNNILYRYKKITAIFFYLLLIHPFINIIV